MSRRDDFRKVLDSELLRWSAKRCDQLITELCDLQAYEVEFDSKQFQVEVQVVENTAEYVHVMVSVDDGSLPGSIFPLSGTFINRKSGQAL